VIASIVSLALVATLGLALATEQGASLDLVPAIIGALVAMVVIGALFVYERPLLWSTDRLIRASRSLTGRPSAATESQVRRTLEWTTAVHLKWPQVTGTVALGRATGLFDCTCFAMMFPAIGAPVPWKGLLLAYGAGQLAATSPSPPEGWGGGGQHHHRAGGVRRRRDHHRRRRAHLPFHQLLARPGRRLGPLGRAGPRGPARSMEPAGPLRSRRGHRSHDDRPRVASRHDAVPAPGESSVAPS